MMRETPINRSVSPIMSLMFPSLFPHPSARPPQDGTPGYTAQARLFLPDLVFTSEDGQHVPGPEVAPTRGPTSV